MRQISNNFLTKAFVSLLTYTASTLFLFSSSVQAQIKLSPFVIETETQNEQAKGVISITNTSNETFRARVYPLPFTYDINGLKEVESNPQDLTPFLTISPRELVVEPGQTRQIRLASRFLPSTPPGEYRVVVYTEDLKLITQQEGQFVIGVQPRIGVTVYVRHGNVSPNLLIESAKYDLKNNQINLFIKNSGNATARPEVTWTLSNTQGIITSGKTEAYTVTPNSERQVTLTQTNKNSPLPAGEYQINGKLSWGQESKHNTLPFSVKFTIPSVK